MQAARCAFGIVQAGLPFGECGVHNCQAVPSDDALVRESRPARRRLPRRRTRPYGALWTFPSRVTCRLGFEPSHHGDNL
jgi:hypothetical protein